MVFIGSEITNDIEHIAVIEPVDSSQSSRTMQRPIRVLSANNTIVRAFMLRVSKFGHDTGKMAGRWFTLGLNDVALIELMFKIWIVQRVLRGLADEIRQLEITAYNEERN